MDMPGRSRIFFCPLTPASMSIMSTSFPQPAKPFQVFDHIHRLERGRDIADLSLG